MGEAVAHPDRLGVSLNSPSQFKKKKKKIP